MPPVNYSELFSREARELKASALADLVNAFHGVPDVVTLHAGLPCAEAFPLTSLHAMTLPLACNPAAAAAGPVSDMALSSTAVPNQGSAYSQAAQPLQVDVQGALMHDAQQYMFHSGHPPLLRWARDFAATYHQPPNPVNCAITSGAVNALACAIACLCDAGDYVICEEFAYTHAAECVFVPRGLNLLPVAMDGEGMLPGSLRDVLAHTPPSPATGKPPRVLYISGPSGQNPTGAQMPLSRKQELYDICRQHGIIVLEDDAYYWLQYPQGDLPEAQQPGLQLPASFLSIDTDSRVLRIDTFSKLLGPGYRLGWVTGAPDLVAKLAQSVQAGSCGPCSLSQVVVSQMLESWGMAGFEAFVRRQQALYARRAAAAVRSAARHLPGLATWQVPQAGMFMWFKLTGLPDMSPELVQQLVQQRVVVIPGRPFWNELSKARSGAPCPYFRVTFGSVPEDRIDEGFRRLAAAIQAATAAQGVVTIATTSTPSTAQATSSTVPTPIAAECSAMSPQQAVSLPVILPAQGAQLPVCVQQVSSSDLSDATAIDVADELIEPVSTVQSDDDLVVTIVGPSDEGPCSEVPGGSSDVLPASPYAQKAVAAVVSLKPVEAVQLPGSSSSRSLQSLAAALSVASSCNGEGASSPQPSPSPVVVATPPAFSMLQAQQ